MAAVNIPCPECGRLLKLPDRALLGKKGRCGKCGHRFILQEPAAPQFAPVDERESNQFDAANFEFDASEENGSTGDETLVGIAARYIPEEPISRGHVPGTVQAAPPARPAPLPVNEPPPAAEIMPLTAPEPEADADTLARVRQRKKAVERRKKITIGVSAVAVVAVSLGTYFGLTGGQNAKSKKKSRAVAAKVQEAEEEPEGDGALGSEVEAQGATPITLALVPEGARIVVHLRPAELWQTGGSAEEFRACLGPVGVWLEGIIKTKCLLEPAKIEELLVALIPISRDEFDVSYVVRTKSDMKKSELIDKFDGELIDQPRQHYVGPERAYLILDARTFASAPKAMVESLLQSVSGNTVTSEGIQLLLTKTDRKQHFTLLCELEDVRLGTKNLAPANAQKLLEGVVDFFGDDVETIAWSLHLGDADTGGTLHSEVLVRNKLSRAPAKLEGDLKKKLAGLPAEILNIAHKTDPKTIGEKKIVGRFPVMTKIVERSTHFGNGHRLVTMQVELPERAGPNLALGTLFAWNQTTLPDYGQKSSAPTVAAADDPKLPEKIADRLKKKITVDFRRTPLQDAIASIAEDTGVKIKLDGPGMKLAGVTQNEVQTFQMEDVPATDVLYKIIIENTKDKLVLIVDEEKKIATVTSVAVAEDKKLKPFPLKPKGK